MPGQPLPRLGASPAVKLKRLGRGATLFGEGGRSFWHLVDFAGKYGLALETGELILGARRRHISGRNGSVVESREPGRLLVSIVYLAGWERDKMEFRLAYRHIRVVIDMCSEMSVCAEFLADDERQARLVIELAQLTTAGVR